MNTSVLPVILLVSVCALAQPATATPPRSYGVGAVGDYVERGTLRIQVLAKLGDPAERLSPDVWVYHRFEPVDGVAADRSCRTLVIVFQRGAVADMKLVNHAAADQIATEVRSRSHGTEVVSREPSVSTPGQ